MKNEDQTLTLLHTKIWKMSEQSISLHELIVDGERQFTSILLGCKGGVEFNISENLIQELGIKELRNNLGLRLNNQVIVHPREVSLECWFNALTKSSNFTYTYPSRDKSIIEFTFMVYPDQSDIKNIEIPFIDSVHGKLEWRSLFTFNSSKLNDLLVNLFLSNSDINNFRSCFLYKSRQDLEGNNLGASIFLPFEPIKVNRILIENGLKQDIT
jgi:hypothetical protein